LIPLLNNAQLRSLANAAQDQTARVQRELYGSLERQKEAVTEKELTYRELLLAYAQLQELNQQKNNFLASATHELRTPVTVMKAITGFCSMDGSESLRLNSAKSFWSRNKLRQAHQNYQLIVGFVAY
jgi:signal transduction histidine kinase